MNEQHITALETALAVQVTLNNDLNRELQRVRLELAELLAQEHAPYPVQPEGLQIAAKAEVDYAT